MPLNWHKCREWLPYGRRGANGSAAAAVEREKAAEYAKRLNRKDAEHAESNTESGEIK